MSKEVVLVLGAGKMTEALLQGLKSSTDLSSYHIYSVSCVSAEKLAQKIGAKHISTLDGISPTWILLGCKPQQLTDLKKTIGDRFNDCLFVSMLAAIPEDVQRSKLQCKKLIRIMPNLPVRYQAGVTLISSQSVADSAAFQQLFAKVGVSLILKEDELEELTLLTGSGPAFFYEFAKNVSESFTSLNQDTREELARAVLLGSGLSVKNSDQKLVAMIDAVTSKGGVTIATLESFRFSELGKLIKSGVEAGKKRSQEIKELILRS